MTRHGSGVLAKAAAGAFGLALGVSAASAAAAEITVLSAAAVQAPITELAEKFERDTGNHVRFEFSTAGGIEKKLRAGAYPEIAINDQTRLAALVADHFVASAPSRVLGVVQIGVAVRKGGTRPDVSSVEAFKASLLKAESVAYGDPAKGPTTGIHFAKVLDTLGIAAAIKPKEMLAPNGLEVMRLVASGKAELGVTQISEIMHIQGDTLVGPLPEALQLKTTYAVTFGRDDASAAARQFVDLMLGTTGRASFTHAGFQ